MILISIGVKEGEEIIIFLKLSGKIYTLKGSGGSGVKFLIFLKSVQNLGGL